MSNEQFVQEKRSKTPTPETLCLFRLKLLEQGYEPIAIRGKETIIPGWPEGSITLDRIIEDIGDFPDHTNTGLRTGRTVGIDIDLRDDEHAELIRREVESILGRTPLRRRGSKGMMLVYRKADDPIGKIMLNQTVEPGEKGGSFVEIFGSGGQFVAYGKHPAGMDYRWLEPECDPLTIPLADLPPVTTALLRRTRDAVGEALEGLGYRVGGRTETTHAGPPPVAGRPGDAVDITALFLPLLPASRPSPSGYFNFPCPSCHCRDGRSGFQINASGGFRFKCQHTGCEFHDPTGWEPSSPYVGIRVIRLYELLGGDPGDLIRQKRPILQGYQSLAEMLAEFKSPDAEGSNV
jgi:hypothetical protein